MNNIFVHIIRPDMIPVGAQYVALSDLQQHENGTVDNIIIQDLFDYLYDVEINDILDTIHNKLTDTGQLHIQGTDLKQLSVAIAFDDIDVDLAKKILYPNKKSVNTLYGMKNALRDRKYTIDTSYYTNVFEYYIIATKNA